MTSPTLPRPAVRPRPTPGRRLGGPVAVSLAGTGTVLLLNTASGFLLARELGPASRGVVSSLLIAPLLIVAIGQLGITDAVTYSMARGGDRAAAEGTLPRLAAVHGLILTALAAATLYGLGLDQGHPWLGLVALTYTLPSLTTQWLAHYANGRGRYLHLNALWLGTALLTAGGLAVLAAGPGLTVTGAVVTTAVANAAVALAAVVAFRRGRVPEPAYSATLARAWLSYGLRAHVSGAADVINERLDQFVVAAVLPPRQLGLYVVAATVTSATSVLGTAFTYVVLPDVTGCATRAQQRARGLAWARLTALLAALATLVLVGAAGVVVRTVFGTAYDSSIPVVRILLLGTGLLSVNRVLMACLKAADAPGHAGRAQLGGVLVTVVLLAVLVPVDGIRGAAITSVVAYAAVTVLLVRSWRRVFPAGA